MKKTKSIFKLTHKYRNANQLVNDHSYKLYKRHKKVESTKNYIYITSDETSDTFLNPHTHVLMIINKDGYIDHILYLYDRKLKFFDSKDIDKKSKNLLEKYYFSTKTDFINSLYENGFVSYFLFTKLKKECL